MRNFRIRKLSSANVRLTISNLDNVQIAKTIDFYCNIYKYEQLGKKLQILLTRKEGHKPKFIDGEFS